MKKILKIALCGTILIGTTFAQSGIVGTVEGALKTLNAKATDKISDCPDGECLEKCKEGFHPSRIQGTMKWICCQDGTEAGKSYSEGCCNPKGRCCSVEHIMDSQGNCCPKFKDGSMLAKRHDGKTECCISADGIGSKLPLPYSRDGQTYTACCEPGMVGIQNGADSDGQCCERGMASDGQNSTCCGFGEHSEVYAGGPAKGGYSKCCKDNEIMGPKGECCVPGTEGCCAEHEHLTEEKCENECVSAFGNYVYDGKSLEHGYYYCGRCHPCPSSAPIKGVFSEGKGTRYGHWDGTCHECPTGQVFSCESPTYCICPNGKTPDNGLCCELNEHNSYGHCCPEDTEWSEHTSRGFLGIGGGKTSGRCCPIGTTFDGEECVGNMCPVNSVYCDEKTGKCG